MKTKTVNVNELQSNISGVLKDVQDDTVYEVMRYSQPIAVVVSYENYLIMKGDCKRCVQELKDIAAVVKSQKETK